MADKKNPSILVLSAQDYACPHCDSKYSLQEIQDFLAAQEHNPKCNHCNRPFYIPLDIEKASLSKTTPVEITPQEETLFSLESTPARSTTNASSKEKKVSSSSTIHFPQMPGAGVAAQKRRTDSVINAAMRRAQGGSLVGFTLGQIEIKEVLGKGGMGVVYLGHHLDLDIDVAVKVLPDDLATDEILVQRFLREARLAVKLNHPHIVRIYNVAQQEGVYYLSMEYVAGSDAARMLRGGKRFAYRKTLEIGLAAASALELAHNEGLIHRDIKPHNILLAKDGSIKVSDFGLACAMDHQSGLTLSGQVMGTPLYMSPEQAETKAVDGRSDIYSLGITLYHMMRGKPPFSGQTPIAIALAHIQKEVPFPKEVFRYFPEKMVSLLKKMVAKNPEQRIQNVQMVREELQRLLATAPSAEIRGNILPEVLSEDDMLASNTPLSPAASLVNTTPAMKEVLSTSTLAEFPKAQGSEDKAPPEIQKKNFSPPSEINGDNSVKAPFFQRFRKALRLATFVIVLLLALVGLTSILQKQKHKQKKPNPGIQARSEPNTQKKSASSANKKDSNKKTPPLDEPKNTDNKNATKENKREAQKLLDQAEEAINKSDFRKIERFFNKAEKSKLSALEQNRLKNLKLLALGLKAKKLEKEFNEALEEENFEQAQGAISTFEKLIENYPEKLSQEKLIAAKEKYQEQFETKVDHVFQVLLLDAEKQLHASEFHAIELTLSNIPYQYLNSEQKEELENLRDRIPEKVKKLFQELQNEISEKIAQGEIDEASKLLEGCSKLPLNKEQKTQLEAFKSDIPLAQERLGLLLELEEIYKQLLLGEISDLKTKLDTLLLDSDQEIQERAQTYHKLLEHALAFKTYIEQRSIAEAQAELENLETSLESIESYEKVLQEVSRLINTMEQALEENDLERADEVLHKLQNLNVHVADYSSKIAALSTQEARWLREIQTGKWYDVQEEIEALGWPETQETLSEQEQLVLEKLENIASPLSRYTFEHGNFIQASAFSANGAHTAIALSSQLKQKLEIRDSKSLENLKASTTIHTEGRVTQLAFGPNQETLIVANGNGFLMSFQLDDLSPIHKVQAHAEKINSFTIEPGQEELISAGEDGYIRCFSLPFFTQKWEHPFGEPVNTLTVSASHNLLIAGGDDGKIEMLTLSTRQFLSNLESYRSSIFDLALSPDGKYLASCGRAVGLVFELDTQKIVFRLPFSDLKAPRQVLFSPHGKLVAFAGNGNRRILFYDYLKKQKVCELSGHAKNVQALFFDREAKVLFSSGGDQSIITWNFSDQLPPQKEEE